MRIGEVLTRAMRRKRKNMGKYIDREALVDWLKRIPLKDLSDGLGLCRVIMEDDFKKAIKEMPKGIIADAVPVVRCRDCKHCDPESHHCDHPMSTAAPLSRKPDDFCSYGERR